MLLKCFGEFMGTLVLVLLGNGVVRASCSSAPKRKAPVGW
jgi:glycerol uptake facilitator-like aquaporin